MFKHLINLQLFARLIGLVLVSLKLLILQISVNASESVPFNPPEFRRGDPDDELGTGGSPRPDCTGLNLSDEVCTAEVIMLVPEIEVDAQSEPLYFGYTTTNTPTFWISIPYNAHELTSGAIFMLLDPDGELVSPTLQVDLSNTPGIIALSLPPETVLSPGIRYTWYFELQITEDSGSLNPIAIGIVEKVATDGSLLEASPLERATYFGERGIWFDALTALMEVREQYPHLLADFLEQAGLSVESADTVQGI